MMNLPKARTENLVEQNLKQETLIYDLNTHRAFNLNETLTIVYQACDGKTSFDKLRRQHKFTDDFIFLALDELKGGNLLDDVSYQSPFANTSRRAVIKKVGLASMMILPLITGLAAPKAAEAASGSANFLPLFSACVYELGAPVCQSGFCVQNYCCAESTVTSPIVLMPGVPYVTTESGSPQLFETGQAPASGACPIACCSGTQPTGGCTYVPDTEDYSEEELAAFQESGFTPYIRTCDCSC